MSRMFSKNSWLAFTLNNLIQSFFVLYFPVQFVEQLEYALQVGGRESYSLMLIFWPVKFNPLIISEMLFIKREKLCIDT